MTASLTVVCLIAVAASLLAMSIKRIPEGQVYTLRRRRRAQPELLTPGMHWIVPLRDHIAHKISLTGRTLRLDDMLEDSQIRVRGTVYWQVLDAERADAVIDQADTLIRRQTLDGLREDRLADASVLNAHLKNRLNSALRPQGMLVTRMDVHTTA